MCIRDSLKGKGESEISPFSFFILDNEEAISYIEKLGYEHVSPENFLNKWKLLQGEGVNSLSRGFFKSGAKSVISSLWSTNDKATATITGDFYKHLSKGKTKSEALRQAKLNYLKNNSDAEASPHYWASLILIGDTGVLLPETNYLWWYITGGILLLLLLGTVFIIRK